MSDAFFNNYIESVTLEFLRYKAIGLKSIQALSEVELNANINDSNSVAIIVKHLHGNMKSRWTNLFTEDGEKPYRNRDREFENGILKKKTVIGLYNEGWSCLESALAKITNNDFNKSVTIRNEPLSLVEALNRQVSHYAYHIGQIVILAKQKKGKKWISLSIPKGKSLNYKQGNYKKKRARR